MGYGDVLVKKKAVQRRNMINFERKLGRQSPITGQYIASVIITKLWHRPRPHDHGHNVESVLLVGRPTSALLRTPRHGEHFPIV